MELGDKISNILFNDELNQTLVNLNSICKDLDGKNKFNEINRLREKLEKARKESLSLSEEYFRLNVQHTKLVEKVFEAQQEKHGLEQEVLRLSPIFNLFKYRIAKKCLLDSLEKLNEVQAKFMNLNWDMYKVYEKMFENNKLLLNIIEEIEKLNDYNTKIIIDYNQNNIPLKTIKLLIGLFNNSKDKSEKILAQMEN